MTIYGGTTRDVKVTIISGEFKGKWKVFKFAQGNLPVSDVSGKLVEWRKLRRKRFWLVEADGCTPIQETIAGNTSHVYIQMYIQVAVGPELRRVLVEELTVGDLVNTFKKEFQCEDVTLCGHDNQPVDHKKKLMDIESTDQAVKWDLRLDGVTFTQYQYSWNDEPQKEITMAATQSLKQLSEKARLPFCFVVFR